MATKEVNKLTNNELWYLGVCSIAITGWILIEEGDLPLLKELKEMNLVEINTDNTEYRFLRKKQLVPNKN